MMNKKIVGIFIMTLLIGTALTSVGMTNKLTDDITKINNCKDGVNQFNGYDFNCENKYSIFNPPVMTIDIEELMEESILYEPLLVDLPEYFSWRDYEGQDWTTSAKAQSIPKYCGSCWAFAALGALESVINIREGIADLDPDLSEQYILSCLPKAGSCEGGSPSWAFKYIMSNASNGNYVNGIIPESYFEYYADDTIPCDNKSLDWEDYLIPISDHGGLIVTTDSIKSKIMEAGPVVGFMLVCLNFSIWGYTNHDPTDYFPYQEERDLSYAIVILGWKDDPSIEKGGYWICKNSFGPNFGYDGFFNIEYESLGIQRNALSWVNYTAEDYDWHPTPKAYGPYYGLINQPLQFTGDASGEHPPFTWHWDFGDDSSSTEQNPTHSYSNLGEYTILLTVTDINDNSFYEKTYAYIKETNTPPQPPTIEGQTLIKKGEYCWYNFTFSDPDGDSLSLYAHFFGLESGVWYGPYPPEYGIENINYYWDEPGDYIVKAKVKDDFGGESDWTILNVTVEKSKAIETSMSCLFFEKILNRFPLIEKILNQIKL